MKEQVTKKKVEKKKIIAVIKRKNVANITGDLHHHGNYCVVGGLLRYAGLGVAKINEFDAGAQDPDARQRLYMHYGLECGDVDRMININDKECGTPERKKKLLEFVENLPDEREVPHD